MALQERLGKKTVMVCRAWLEDSDRQQGEAAEANHIGCRDSEAWSVK